MKSKQLYENNGLRTFALIFDKGDAVREKLVEFATANRFSNVQITAIGAFSEVTLGYFDRRQRDYTNIPVKEQVEVLSFAGNIAQKEGKPLLHAHVVVGKSDGTAMGGHFLGGKVWPTLEMVVTELPVQLTRALDEETGLPLINLAA